MIRMMSLLNCWWWWWWCPRWPRGQAGWEIGGRSPRIATLPPMHSAPQSQAFATFFKLLFFPGPAQYEISIKNGCKPKALNFGYILTRRQSFGFLNFGNQYPASHASIQKNKKRKRYWKGKSVRKGSRGSHFHSAHSGRTVVGAVKTFALSTSSAVPSSSSSLGQSRPPSGKA